jgi:tRNA(Ile)-lysidine synthase
LGALLDFPSTEALRTLALTGRAGQKRELAQGLLAERSPRELRLAVGKVGTGREGSAESVSEYDTPIPGEILAPFFGLRLRVFLTEGSAVSQGISGQPPAAGRTARLRNWKPGDLVTLRHSSGPRKVKEVLERLRITGTRRAVWPVLELDGRIVWMRGVELQPEPGIDVVAIATEAVGAEPSENETSG